MADITKAFIGCWVAKDTRTKFKVACAVHGVNQGDVIDFLIQHWINKKHVREEIEELWKKQTKIETPN